MEKLENDLNEKDLITNDERESLLKDKRKCTDQLKGTLVAFLVAFKYAASGVSVQLLDRRIPDLELNAIRNGGVCILYLIVLLLRGRYPYVPKRIFGGLAVYALVTTMCSAIIFISMAMVPVSAAQSLQQNSSNYIGNLTFCVDSEGKSNNKDTIVVIVVYCWNNVSDSARFLVS